MCVCVYYNVTIIVSDKEIALLLVFKYFTITELLQLQRVCKLWYKVSKHPLLWQRLILTNIIVSHQVSITS